MSVDIFICAVDEKKSIDFIKEGIPDPSFWFGDAKYVENIWELDKKELSIIDDSLEKDFLDWVGTMRDYGEQKEAEEFLNENKGKFISIFIG